MIEQPSEYPLDHVSVLVSVRDSGRPRCQGTAFPFLRSDLWLTAAHCVHNWRGPDTLALVRTGPGHTGVDGVTSVETHPDLDLAVLASASAAAVPFPEAGTGRWGSEVSVVGYPEDLFLDAQGQDRPRARLLKATSSGSSSRVLTPIGRATSSSASRVPVVSADHRSFCKADGRSSASLSATATPQWWIT